jgi:hypothetical protein
MVMKNKLLLFVIVFLLGRLTAFAQVEKGDWFINGLSIISFHAGTMKYESDYGSSKTNITELYYGPAFIYGSMDFANAPTINYGILDKLSGGIFLNINLRSTKEEGDDEKTISDVFAIGPSFRYYFTDENKFLPFAEGKAGFGSFSEKYGDNDASKFGLSGWYLGTGGTFFFKPKIGIDFTIGYGSMIAKDKDTADHDKMTISGVNISVGVLAGF